MQAFAALLTHLLVLAMQKTEMAKSINSEQNFKNLQGRINSHVTKAKEETNSSFCMQIYSKVKLLRKIHLISWLSQRSLSAHLLEKSAIENKSKSKHFKRSCTRLLLES